MSPEYKLFYKGYNLKRIVTVLYITRYDIIIFELGYYCHYASRKHKKCDRQNLKQEKEFRRIKYSLISIDNIC